MTQALDIYGSLDQARRCIDVWLEEEGRYLPDPLRQRAAALMARYFLHEQDVTDALMLSFLRHYSGLGAVDLDDISSVKMELKSVLDKSAHLETARLSRVRRKGGIFFGAGVAVTMLAFLLWHAATLKISREQQAQLRLMVEEVATVHKVSHASVWARIKGPLAVERYQDIPWWQYGAAREKLVAVMAGQEE